MGKELQGELPDGTTARWTSLLDETLLALPSDYGLHPRLHEEEDPDRRGYRAVRVGQWRLIFRATEDAVVVVDMVHVRAQLRPVIDRG